MNTALIITGHMRRYTEAFPNFNSRIIERFKPDIFISTWSDLGYWAIDHAADHIDPTSPPLDVADVRRRYNPVDMQVENFKDIEPSILPRIANFPNHGHQRPENFVSQCYKVMSGVQMMERHVAKTGKKYDLVIRARPDLVLDQPLPSNFDSDCFYTGWQREPDGTDDKIHIGSQKAMVQYGRIGMFLEEMYPNISKYCPHKFVFSFIRDHVSAKHVEFNCPHTILHHPKGQYAQGNRPEFR